MQPQMDKKEWISLKTKHDLALMNQFIQPMPFFPKTMV